MFYQGIKQLGHIWLGVFHVAGGKIVIVEQLGLLIFIDYSTIYQWKNLFYSETFKTI